MAVATGTQIRPELSAVDYTPFVQAAAQGAQMQAQGIAALGQSVAAGVDQYLKKKEEKRQEDEASQMITGILKTNPGLSSQLKLAPDEQGNFDKGAIKAAIKGAGGPVNAIKLAMTLEELGNQQKARREQQAAASYASLLSQGGGSIPAPISNQALAQFSPEARMAGQAAYLQQARQAAELAKTRAETNRLQLPAQEKRLPMVDVLFNNLAEAKQAELGRNLTAKEQSDLAIEALRSGQPLPTPKEEAEKARLVARAQAEEKSYADIRGSILSNVPKYTEIMDQNRIGRELIQSGETVQGPGSNVRLAIMRGVNAVFPNTFDTSKSEVLSKTYKSMALTAASKMKGQGQITESERKLLADTVASMGDTQQAAMFIMAFSDAVAARELARADFLSSSEKGGAKPSEGALTIEFYRDNPLENFLDETSRNTLSGKKSEKMSRVFGGLQATPSTGTSPLRNLPKSDIDRANGILQKYKLTPITFGGQPE